MKSPELRLLLWTIVLLVLSRAVSAGEAPGQLLDLSSWKLTAPVAREGSKDAAEIRQPELATFQDQTSFFVDSKLKGVVFRAPCGGVTTKGSKYPRCELRELYGTGKDWAVKKWARFASFY